MKGNDVSSMLTEEGEKLSWNEETVLPSSPDEEKETRDAEEAPTQQEDDQAIQKTPTTANHLEIDTTRTTPRHSPESPQFSTPVKPVQYVDERTKVLGRKAELEELRKRSDMKKKKAAFKSESPMSTSLSSFFLQQKLMKLEVTKNRQGALSSLSNYRSKDGEGGILATKNVKGNNTFSRQGMPSAYSTMADIDGFFRKQKQMDQEWKKNKESTLKRLHMFRQAHIGNGESDVKDGTQNDNFERKPGVTNKSDLDHHAGTDEEVFSSLLMVHAELVQFFTAFSSSPGQDSAPGSPLQSESEVGKSEQVPHTPIITTAENEKAEDLVSQSPNETPSIEHGTLENEEQDESTPGIPELPNNADVQGANDETTVQDFSAGDTHGALLEVSGPAKVIEPSEVDLPVQDVDVDNSLEAGMQPSSLAENEQQYSAVEEECQEVINGSNGQGQEGDIAHDNPAEEDVIAHDNPAEEEDDDDDAFDILDEILDDSYVMEKGTELLDPFSEPRQSFDNSDQQRTLTSCATQTKSLPEADEEKAQEEAVSPVSCCEGNEDRHHDISSIPAMSPIRTVGSLVSSMGSSIDEDTVGSGRLSRESSSSSLSTFWDLEKDIPAEETHYSEALMCSEEQYLPNLHNTKGPCERCLSLASEAERIMFRVNGRHVRIMLVRGGCKRSCTAFPRRADEAPVRLCRKCYFDTHRKPRTPTSERCHYS